MGLTDRHVEAVRKGARVSRGLSTRNQHPRFALLSLSYLSRPRSIIVSLSLRPSLPSAICSFFLPLSSPAISLSLCFSLSAQCVLWTILRFYPFAFGFFDRSGVAIFERGLAGIESRLRFESTCQFSDETFPKVWQARWEDV